MTGHILFTLSIDVFATAGQGGAIMQQEKCSKKKAPPFFKGGAKERWSGETD
jgi:hypothetical protein